jgi:4-hydroxythreonine-4-phosphate dehydrogenase
MSDTKPLVALTLGDPAGVGPEVIVGAWTESIVHEWCRPLVIGHPEILRRAVRLWRTGVQVVEIDSADQAQPSSDFIPCLPCGSDEVLGVEPGEIHPCAGQAAYDAVVTAIDLALNGQINAITTAPLHKKALRKAGHNYPGHTELLAAKCGAGEFAMMLYLGQGDVIQSPSGLAVVHVTLHTALRDVFQRLSVEDILAKAHLADRFMTRLNGRRPRIGVAAINPHAGEGGLFGDEESIIIGPAVARARDEGLKIQGPFPADTLMGRACAGHFDAVVAMYHDQGHITLKLVGMYRAVNVTLGLPIVRTSVAHGTAFDIAWQRRAECGGMVEAIRVASRLATLG